MLTKADFMQAVQDSIATYPSIAPLYQAGDPRILQHLEAIATMLAMVSAQLETAMAEPFEKVRDATVLADAAMRGIVRQARPARVRLSIINQGDLPCLIESGRTLMDSSGLLYQVATPVSIPAGETATLEALQQRQVTLKHTVQHSLPFYAIELPITNDGADLCAIAVSDQEGEFCYRDRYVNTLSGERVFHVEADDRQRVYVRFGLAEVVGVAPPEGSTITLTLSYCAGEINLAFGSPFAFEYLRSPLEAGLSLQMDALLLPGQNPISMSVLRDLARYPSVYDDNAVFLGEFDFLVRRHFPTLPFLAIWNEAAEERVRGASLDHINVLFVACLSSMGNEQVLIEVDPQDPVHPLFIAEENLTATQRDIRHCILQADDSYKVRFVTPVRSAIVMAIHARAATAYVASDVREQIIEVILQTFGEQAAASRRGYHRPLYQRVYALLREKIPALSAGEADLTVQINTADSLSHRPEMWRYVSADSLTVSVETINTVTPSWRS
ncbi:hypothetical protein HZU77_006875 [Neisseriaceae bacterium TC5R-5]|nr:hypothetical protein [Neisseriaceae bacterium TC5R-5]